MTIKGERFLTNLREINSQVVNTNVFFNSKKHLQKEFFAKIKIVHRKWHFVRKKTLVSVFFSCKYSDHQKIRLSKPNSTEKKFLQNNEK